MKNAKPDLQLYARQWGATAVPFTQLDQKSWLQTPTLQTGWTRLDQNAQLRGVLLLSGPNGVGKSMLASRWLHQLDTRLFHPLSLTQATLSGSSLLSLLTMQLGKPAGFRRERNLERIEAALAELDRQIPVLVLDEAQNYSYPALEEVRLLLGLSLRQQPSFALVLIGDDYLLGTLRLRHHRALYSRITSHVELSPWNAQQVADYLEAGFAAVGVERQSVEPAAVELLASASGGLPRSLASLARAAWIEAASQQVRLITPDHVQKAIELVPCTPGLRLPPPSQTATTAS